MPQVFSTVLLCILLAAALFFSVRKLWKDKKIRQSWGGGSWAGLTGGTGYRKILHKQMNSNVDKNIRQA